MWWTNFSYFLLVIIDYLLILIDKVIITLNVNTLGNIKYPVWINVLVGPMSDNTERKIIINDIFLFHKKITFDAHRSNLGQL